VSDKDCVPQRVIVNLGGKPPQASISGRSSATGRALGNTRHERIKDQVWYRLAEGESCEVPAKTAVTVLCDLSSDMKANVLDLHFRGPGLLTGPLTYRKQRYMGLRFAVAMGAGAGLLLSAIFFGIPYLALDAPQASLRQILSFGSAVTGALAVWAAGAVLLSSCRKTRELRHPDFEALEVGVEVVTAEVKS